MTGPPAEEATIVASETLGLIREAHAALRMAVDALECEDENERASVWDAVLGGVDDVSVLTKLELWLEAASRWRCDRCGGSWQTAEEAAASTPCDVNHDPARGFVKQALASGGSGEEVELRRCPKCKRLTTAFECCYVKGPPLIPQLDDSTMTVPVRGVFIEGGSGEAPAARSVANELWEFAHYCDSVAPECVGAKRRIWLDRAKWARGLADRLHSGEAPADRKQRRFLERHGGRMGRVDVALAKARGEAPAGLTEEERLQLDEWLTMAEERFPSVSYYVTKAIFKLRAALRAPSSTEGD